MAQIPSPIVTGNAALIPPVNLTAAAGANPVFGAGTTGDTNNRVELDANGSIRWGTGAAALDTTLSRQAIGVLQTGGKLLVGNGSGALDVTTTGFGLQVAEGANAKQGIATLAAGTVTVANTSVTASSRIFVTCQILGTVTVASAFDTPRTAGTSFTIHASQATDTSTVAWEIFEPG